jgi:tripartite-type tricarboxylate transporter receptor subunit TctC
MKIFIAIVAVLLMTVTASAREVIEVTTRLAQTSATGQFLIEIVDQLNETQSKYEYRISFIPGFGGAENRIAAIADSGRKGVFYGAQSVFTISKYVNPEGQKQVKDITKDFIFVGSMSMGTTALMVDPKKGYKSVSDLVSVLKKKDKIFFGTTVGSSNVILMNQIFLEHYGLKDKVQTIYYQRPGDLLRGTLGGEVDYNVFNPYSMNGNLQILMTANDNRGTIYPNVPTGKESSIPKFNYNAITLFAIHKNNIEFAAEFMKQIDPVCKNETIRERVRTRGYEPVCLSPAQINRMVEEENKMLETMDIKSLLTKGAD